MKNQQNKKRILIIEDEAGLLEMYRLYFERAGYKVETASNGHPGIELAIQEKPDIVLLDILMPNCSGWEVIKKLRKNPKTKNIPILVFSNLGQTEEIKKGLRLGADDYVVKTDLTPKELLAKVDRMVSYLKKKRPKYKKRVLIIEDEKDLANLYKMRLEKENFEVEIARNGAWGLRLAKVGDFNLILMDMVMPAMDGFEALKTLKEDPRTSKIPIIVFSNSTQEEEIRKAMDMGAEKYFIKSKIVPRELVKEIKLLLKEQKSK